MPGETARTCAGRRQMGARAVLVLFRQKPRKDAGLCYAGAVINLAAADFRAPRWRARPAGMGSIIEHDLESRPQWTPWLAAVAVNRAARGRGNSSPLVRFMEFCAQEWRRSTLLAVHLVGGRSLRQVHQPRRSTQLAVRISTSAMAVLRVGAPLARITVALLRGRRNRARIASSTHSLQAGSLGADQLPSVGAACPLFPTARCQIIPGSWVSNARDNLSDRFGDQLWFVLMDVVAALSGDEEARVRDKRRQIFVGRVQY